MAIRLFVYGALLTGEPGHAVLDGIAASAIKTATGYSLVEAGPLAALVEEGEGVVAGEVYELERDAFMRVTRQEAHAGLFELSPVRLEDGTTAQTFLLPVDRARGKRRIKGGDWRARFGGSHGGVRAGPFVTWSRGRAR